jgi:hypothetical protein
MEAERPSSRKPFQPTQPHYFRGLFRREGWEARKDQREGRVGQLRPYATRSGCNESSPLRVAERGLNVGRVPEGSGRV